MVQIRKQRKMKESKKAKETKNIEDQLLELEKELIKLNTQVATGTTLKSPGQVSKIKKSIARLQTKINQK